MEAGVLIGRERELEVLDHAIAQMGGQSALLVLSGEPGIGKSRLLEVLGARIVESGGVVARGRTWEGGVTPSFWPWLQGGTYCVYESS